MHIVRGHLVAVVIEPFLPGLMLGLYAFIAFAAFQIGRPLLDTPKVQATDRPPTAKHRGRALRGFKRTGLLLVGVLALAALSRKLEHTDLWFLAFFGFTIGTAGLGFNVLRLLASPLFGRMEARRARKIAAGGSLLALRVEAIVGLALLVAAAWGGITIGGILRLRH